MIEPTIVFTHHALLLTASTFLLIGSLIGWAVTSYVRTREINNLRSDLRELQIELAETRELQDKKIDEKPTSPALSSLSKKKDRLLKEFMRRQLQQKKSLDKLGVALQDERRNKLNLENRLNSTNLSLDQWKEKCSVLAAANTKLRTGSTKTGSKAFANKTNIQKNPSIKQQIPTGAVATAKPGIAIATQAAPATIKLAPLTITSSRKTTTNVATVETRPQTTTHKSNKQYSAKEILPAKAAMKTSADTPAPLDETLAAGVVSKPEKTGSVKTTVVDEKLTRVNGIGPAIETALNELGIKNIQQMAQLKKQEVRELDKQLGKYSGRIERQEWVKQAKKLSKSVERQTEAA